MFWSSQKSIVKAAVLFLSLACCFSFAFSQTVTPHGSLHGRKIYFYYNSPLHPSVYRIVKGSVSGIQKVFEDHNHDTIKKDEEFTVLLNFESPLHNKERQWYEIPARFCYGDDIEGCVRNQTRSFINPYLVRPSSQDIPVPFVVPFSKLHRVKLPDGRTVYEAGTVHEQFKTFKVNGAEYDTSSGILVRFSAESPEKAGKISGIDFLRDQGRTQQHQPLVQCHFVEWIADGCVPGLDNLMVGYDVKFMELRGRHWLKAMKFPNHKDERYLQPLYIPEIGQKNFLVFKDMALEKVTSAASPFSYLFSSVEEQVNRTLKSVGLDLGLRGYGEDQSLGSGKYERFSKHYVKQSYSAALAGTEFRFFHASLSIPYLEDEGNWNDVFKRRWKDIFDKPSNKEKAMNFFKDYGTHYVVRAVMGGRQESVFTVDYCKVGKTKSSKLAFEADIRRPYEFYSSSVGVQEYYKYKRSQSLVNILVSDPQTKCIGGNYLDLEVCHNLTLWRSSVLANPYPIRMTLKPFYTIVKRYEDALWLKTIYEEYLKADLNEEKVNKDIKLKVKCEEKSPKADPTGLSGGAIAGIVIGALVCGVILGFGILICWFVFIKKQRVNFYLLFG